MVINRRVMGVCNSRRNSVAVLVTLNICMVIAVMQLYSNQRERVFTMWRRAETDTINELKMKPKMITETPKIEQLETTEVAETTTALPDLKSNHHYFPDYLPDCPDDDRLLVGSMTIDLDSFKSSYMTMLNSSKRNTNSTDEKYLGQFVEEQDVNSRTSVVFEPSNCRAKHTVAIIIPFRDREEHLKILLGHILPVLQRQLVRFSVFVATQHGNGTFNKGRVMNSAFKYVMEAGKIEGYQPFDCYIFHDVDLLMEHDTLFYRCAGGDSVKHLSTTIDKFGYKSLCCGITVGGVLAFTEDQYKKINGYSNEFWGWGGEDDDMNYRISNHHLTIARPDNVQGRYTMVKHNRDGGNPSNNKRMKLLANSNERSKTDGLSNLDSKIISIQRYQLFVNINIDVGKQS